MKDRIIQITDSDESGITGLSESGALYSFMPVRYQRDVTGRYIQDNDGDLVIDKPAHWRLVIDSPEQEHTKEQ